MAGKKFKKSKKSKPKTIKENDNQKLTNWTYILNRVEHLLPFFTSTKLLSLRQVCKTWKKKLEEYLNKELEKCAWSIQQFILHKKFESFLHDISSRKTGYNEWVIDSNGTYIKRDLSEYTEEIKKEEEEEESRLGILKKRYHKYNKFPHNNVGIYEVLKTTPIQSLHWKYISDKEIEIHLELCGQKLLKNFKLEKNYDRNRCSLRLHCIPNSDFYYFELESGKESQFITFFGLFKEKIYTCEYKLITKTEQCKVVKHTESEQKVKILYFENSTKPCICTLKLSAKGISYRRTELKTKFNAIVSQYGCLKFQSLFGQDYITCNYSDPESEKLQYPIFIHFICLYALSGELIMYFTKENPKSIKAIGNILCIAVDGGFVYMLKQHFNDIVKNHRDMCINTGNLPLKYYSSCFPECYEGLFYFIQHKIRVGTIETKYFLRIDAIIGVKLVEINSILTNFEILKYYPKIIYDNQNVFMKLLAIASDPDNDRIQNYHFYEIYFQKTKTYIPAFEFKDEKVLELQEFGKKQTIKRYGLEPDSDSDFSYGCDDYS